MEGNGRDFSNAEFLTKCPGPSFVELGWFRLLTPSLAASKIFGSPTVFINDAKVLILLVC